MKNGVLLCQADGQHYVDMCNLTYFFIIKIMIMINWTDPSWNWIQLNITDAVHYAEMKDRIDCLGSKG